LLMCRWCVVDVSLMCRWWVVDVSLVCDTNHVAQCWRSVLKVVWNTRGQHIFLTYLDVLSVKCSNKLNSKCGKYLFRLTKKHWLPFF
jgi:hypothetical protein